MSLSDAVSSLFAHGFLRVLVTVTQRRAFGLTLIPTLTPIISPRIKAHLKKLPFLLAGVALVLLYIGIHNAFNLN